LEPTLLSTIEAYLKIIAPSKAYMSFFLTPFMTTMDPLNTFKTPFLPLKTYPFFSASQRDIIFFFKLGINLTSPKFLSFPS